ncbi:MAG: heavy metal-binding domain-containing protein, partial [Pirellulales bacterium]
QAEPGKCPLCGMDLVREGGSSSHAPSKKSGCCG